ncbi:MAG: alkaline phosphatase [Saprospiraceae bacterium]|nr:alkaline phosphatase [Saprospiraceae bacterium]MDW8230594.1 alkaline phosphatase [Saprospiraceae bacterium]
MKYVVLLSAIVLAFQGSRWMSPPAEANSAPAPLSTPTPSPRNIILLIGDGMGIAQITAGIYARADKLHIERFPITGLMKTHSAKHLITDSAAGATAFACGCKTYNGAIGVDAQKKPCRTILEDAAAVGMATGLVATSSITHATPAAFIAHVSKRSEMEEIAPFFLQNRIDLFIGGGLSYFNQRADGRDLCRELQAKGFDLYTFQQHSLNQCQPNPARPFAWFAADKEPEGVHKGRDYLPLAARIAPAFLAQRSERGFFLMIEGSQIDWACHKNNGEHTVQEMLDFDDAIGEALRFAEQDGNTLVIVTADHETGGMALLRGNDKKELKIKFATLYHTASLVPVFAYGPGAEAFSGVYDNTDLHTKMKALLKLDAVEAR